jgi:acylphosphatase
MICLHEARQMTTNDIDEINETTTRIHAFFTGGVQGVYFRANTRDKANELGLHGWVKNLLDGRVEAVFEGTKEKISSLITWCDHSMPLAHVTSIAQNTEEPEHIHGFTIIR